MLRAPLTRFVLLGIVMFTVYAARERTHAGTDARGEREALFQAAAVLGIDRQAAVVGKRLADIGNFLELHEDSDSVSVQEDARNLGLARTDPIIRRHMEQLAELALHSGGATVLPSVAEVEEYYAAHQDRFVDAPRIRLSQVYFSFDRRRRETESDARAVLARLRATGAPPAAGSGEGDLLVRGLPKSMATRAELERAFGSELAATVAALPVGSWSEPLRSPYGLHLVWIHERTAARRVPLTAVRNQIVHRLARERAARLAARRLELVRRTVAGQTP